MKQQLVGAFNTRRIAAAADCEDSTRVRQDGARLPWEKWSGALWLGAVSLAFAFCNGLAVAAETKAGLNVSLTILRSVAVNVGEAPDVLLVPEGVRFTIEEHAPAPGIKRYLVVYEP